MVGPVEGREHPSHKWKAEKIYRLAKGKSMALALCVPGKENRVYRPGVLRRVKPKSAA